jgi:ribosomal protein S18 acetylase RimI-like enzyme
MTTIRRLGPGDDAVAARLATYPGPADRAELLTDARAFFLVAFDEDEPVGFVLAHELPRRHGDPSKLFVYEVGVEETHRRRGIATALLGELASLARERGIASGFVPAEPDNDAANALYESAGGTNEGTNVLWGFRYADG